MANPRRLRCTVSEVVYHSDEVSSIRLEPEKRPPRFKPGQFLHLALDEFDPTTGYWPESRVFSIASKPGEDSLLVVYAVKGGYTARMRRELEKGKAVWCKLPYGEFTMQDNDAEELTLIAGGTGFTPFASFLANALSAGGRTKIRLLYGVRRPELVIFDDLLVKLQSSLEDFRLGLLIEQGAEDYRALAAEPGRLSVEKAIEITEQPEVAAYYLSGPPAMIEAFKKGLAERGVEQKNIFVDEWE